MEFCILNIAVPWDELAARVTYVERFVRVRNGSVHWSSLSLWRQHVILSHEVNSVGHCSELNHFQMAGEAAEMFSLLHSERVKLTLGLIYSWWAGYEVKQKGYITTVYLAQIAPGIWMLSRNSNEKSEQSGASCGLCFIRFVNKLTGLETEFGVTRYIISFYHYFYSEMSILLFFKKRKKKKTSHWNKLNYITFCYIDTI